MACLCQIRKLAGCIIFPYTAFNECKPVLIGYKIVIFCKTLAPHHYTYTHSDRINKSYVCLRYSAATQSSNQNG